MVFVAIAPVGVLALVFFFGMVAGGTAGQSFAQFLLDYGWLVIPILTIPSVFLNLVYVKQRNQDEDLLGFKILNWGIYLFLIFVALVRATVAYVFVHMLLYMCAAERGVGVSLIPIVGGILVVIGFFPILFSLSMDFVFTQKIREDSDSESRAIFFAVGETLIAWLMCFISSVIMAIFMSPVFKEVYPDINTFLPRIINFFCFGLLGRLL